MESDDSPKLKAKKSKITWKNSICFLGVLGAMMFYCVYVLFFAEDPPLQATLDESLRNYSSFGSDSSIPGNSANDEENEYPVFIPKTSVRKDVFTNETVQRGRLELIGGVTKFMRDSGELFDRSFPKVSYEEFSRALQCNPIELDLDWKRGTLKLAQLVPVTRGTLQVPTKLLSQFSIKRTHM